VEGYKRRTDREFSYFLSIADGSLEETKYHLFLVFELKYIRKEDYERLSKIADEVGSMLFCFQKKLKA
jgi:four helix bundle protein